MHDRIDLGREDEDIGRHAQHTRHREDLEHGHGLIDHDREEPRQHQPDRHLAEGRGGLRSRHEGRLLERRVHGTQKRHQHQERGGNDPQALDQDHAPKRVDVEWHGFEIESPHEEFVDIADARARQQHPGHGLEHARHRKRHRHARIEPDLAGNVGPLHQPGKGRGQRDTEYGGAGYIDEGIGEDGVGVGGKPDFRIVLQPHLGQREFRRQAGGGKTTQDQEQEGREDEHRDHQEHGPMPGQETREPPPCSAVKRRRCTRYRHALPWRPDVWRRRRPPGIRPRSFNPVL